MRIAVLAKEPASLTIEDALTVGCAHGSFMVQLSTSTGFDAVTHAAGMGTMEYFGKQMPAYFLGMPATPSDDRNLAVAPLLLELLKALEKLPDFAFCGVLCAFACVAQGRPAVGAALLDLGAIDVLVGILRQASPTDLIATAGYSRKPHGMAIAAIKEIVESGQAGGSDCTAQLLSCGCIDMVVSALSEVENVGADNCQWTRGYLGCLVDAMDAGWGGAAADRG